MKISEMKEKVLCAALAGLLLFGCSASEKPQDSTVETVVMVTETTGAPKTLANLAIEGMACERACGGSIKKALMNLEGVIATEIKFDSDEAVDFAVVEFDESKISAEEMVKAVSALHKGQFTVKSVAVEKQVVKSGETSQKRDSKSAKSESQTGKVSSQQFTLPNVLDILNHFLR